MNYKESSELANRYVDFYNNPLYDSEDGKGWEVTKSEDIIHKYLGDKMYDMDVDEAVDALPTDGKLELFDYLNKVEYETDHNSYYESKSNLKEGYYWEGPSVNHVEYVLDNVMNWTRDYTFSKRSLKQIAKACERYDNNYSAQEYLEVIKNYDLLNRPTKDSNYRTSYY